jgi:hypothetical protein
MPDTLTARLSEPISRPELSKMWESERTTFTTGSGDGIDTFLTAPELVLDTQGNDVTLSFLSGGEANHQKLKEAFERAIHRYLPHVSVEWKPQTRTAG